MSVAGVEMLQVYGVEMMGGGVSLGLVSRNPQQSGEERGEGSRLRTAGVGRREGNKPEECQRPAWLVSPLQNRMREERQPQIGRCWRQLGSPECQVA